MSKLWYILALGNAAAGGILYAIDSRGWVPQVLIVVLLLVEGAVTALKK
jgi:hypothetical protein